MSKTITYLSIVVGAVCVYFIIRVSFFTDLTTRAIPQDVLQGFLIGFGLALLTAQLYARVKAVRVNGWTTMYGLGVPGNGMLLRAAHAQFFPGPVNVPPESMYWWVNTDGNGRALDGRHNYIMHFPAGGLPPNSAFWSLTLGTTKNRFVPNPLNRYSVSDHAGLVENPDGSLDIYIQATSPAGHESNWLPAPADNFLLWLRVYLPGDEILERRYIVPPVTKAETAPAVSGPAGR